MFDLLLGRPHYSTVHVVLTMLIRVLAHRWQANRTRQWLHGWGLLLPEESNGTFNEWHTIEQFYNPWWFSTSTECFLHSTDG